MNRTETTTPCTIENFSVATFMNFTYFDLKKSYHDISRGMYCFIMDKKKLGTMTKKQIKDTMSVLKYFVPHGFDAKSLDNFNTTLLFEMSDSEGFNPAKEVNECIYDLDNKKVITRKNRWSKEHPFNAGTEKFPDEAWKNRKQLYTEWERIGKTLSER